MLTYCAHCRYPNPTRVNYNNCFKCGAALYGPARRKSINTKPVGNPVAGIVGGFLGFVVGGFMVLGGLVGILVGIAETLTFFGALVGIPTVVFCGQLTGWGFALMVGPFCPKHSNH